MRPGRPYVWLKKFCEGEGLQFKAIHSFRHSAATNLIHDGVDIAAVSNILGHNTPNVTLGIYAHEVKEATAYGCDIMSQLLAKHRA